MVVVGRFLCPGGRWLGGWVFSASCLCLGRERGDGGVLVVCWLMRRAGELVGVEGLTFIGFRQRRGVGKALVVIQMNGTPPLQNRKWQGPRVFSLC